jgi:hypothetical protein
MAIHTHTLNRFGHFELNGEPVRGIHVRETPEDTGGSGRLARTSRDHHCHIRRGIERSKGNEY